MSRYSTFRRAAAAAGATALVALSLAGPAAARPDPGTGELAHCTSGCFEGGTAPIPNPVTAPITARVTASDHGVEYVQLGVGVLAGIALAGAGAAAATRRSHAHLAHTA